jgi:hypothetical protein
MSPRIPADRATRPRSSPEQGLPTVASTLVWAGLAVALAALAGAGLAVGDSDDLPGWSILVFLGLVSTAGGVGALLATRRPRNAVGWLLWGWALTIGLNLASMLWATNSVLHHGGTLPGTMAAAWFASWSLTTAIATLLAFLPLLFPNGRLPSPRWRLVAIALVGVLLLATAPYALGPGPLIAVPQLQNPLGLELLAPAMPTLLAANDVAPFAILPVMAIAPIVRYRTGSDVTRQQLKWFAWAMGLAIGGLLLAFAAPPGPLSDAGWIASMVTMGALVPGTIALAILRYRLYDIDRIISRTVAYAVLSGLLALTFGGLVLGIQGILGGFTEGDTLAVAASTLAVVALFQPLRRRIQRAVDRRFNRARIDAEATSARFAERLRDEVDLEAIRVELTQAATSALAPAVAGTWVRGAGSGAGSGGGGR